MTRFLLNAFQHVRNVFTKATRWSYAKTVSKSNSPESDPSSTVTKSDSSKPDSSDAREDDDDGEFVLVTSDDHAGAPTSEPFMPKEMSKNSPEQSQTGKVNSVNPGELPVDADDMASDTHRSEISKKIRSNCLRRSNVHVQVQSSKIERNYKFSELEASIRLLIQQSLDVANEQEPCALDEKRQSIPLMAATVGERLANFRASDSSVAEEERKLADADDRITVQLQDYISTFPGAESSAELAVSDDIDSVRDDEASDTSDPVWRLNDRKGDLGILNERLQEYILTHIEENTERELQRDQEQVLEVSDEDFELEFHREVAKFKAEIQDKEAEIRDLEELCRREGRSIGETPASPVHEVASSQAGEQGRITEIDPSSGLPVQHRSIIPMQYYESPLASPVESSELVVDSKPGRIDSARIVEWSRNIESTDRSPGVEDSSRGFIFQ